ncbi:FAD-dependent monooxygenase [Streptomyces sp. NBC_01794]|uniref:FAD-dependent monooxygenase n=1 Tax=Streptomyces sp. NBC_01794 TaxID=2975942 RepID=UPI003085EF20|nr:FAD-dependent monooxygenase [Streptomyces sp. NBC_01794]
MADVIIAGAGPVGLMLACELRLAGVDVLVLERLAERNGESRAGGLHARSVELLDQRGIADRFLAAGRTGPLAHFSFIPLDIGDLPTRHPYALAIHQSRVERLLEERAIELGVRLRRSAEVIGLRQDGTGVEVQIAGVRGTERLRAGYLVGCDGGRSAVRKLAGIGYPGTPATVTALMGDVKLTDPPPGIVFGAESRREHGSFMIFDSDRPDTHRVITMEFDKVTDRDAPVTLEALRLACIKIAGTDFGMHSPHWLSSFSDAARQADRYREGRVLLAGDAAHIHFPSSGQGMNLGLQDAVNLGWKLAAVARGQATEELLDSYHAERHPATERMLGSIRAQTALWRPGAQTDALREVFGALVEFEDTNRYLGGVCTQLDIRYPVGDGHPALGRRMPDLDIKTPSGQTRAFELLHAARPVLLDFTGRPDLRAALEGWTDRVDLVEAECQDDHWTYPVIGDVPAPAAVLIRPDGHVAWAAPTAPAGSATPETTTAALTSALTRWFGPAQGR